MSFRRRLGRAKERLFLPYRVVAEFEGLHERLERLERQIVLVREALGRVEGRQTEALEASAPLARREFRVFSQWGEDGIVRHLVDAVPVPRETFVEIGVESYQEANTRFLLVERNWRGLLVEADPRHVGRIRRHRLHWLHDLAVEQALVTRENVDEILERYGMAGDVGLLSIDVDGMDYWIWEALEASRPAIVVIEYNHLFGPDEAVVVPYRPDFDRRKAHHSLLYYGASLPALVGLGERKGYAFVGAGRAGLNAFFVRRDLLPDSLRERSAREGFVDGRFNEAHDEAGRRVEMAREDRVRLVFSLPLERVPPPSSG